MENRIEYRAGDLLLRSADESDQAEVARTWPSGGGSLSGTEARAQIARMGRNRAKNTPGKLHHLCLAVCRPEHPQIILGWCGLDGRRNPREPELFVLLGEPHRNQGIGTQCVKALLRIAVQDFSLPGVRGGCRKDNHASRRAMEKAGMVQYAQEENGDPLFRYDAQPQEKRLP